MTAKIRLLLRDLRTARELSQEELAHALNLSRQSIISLERGEYLPSSPVLLGMMEFFNCDLAELVEGIRLRPIQQIDHDESEQILQLTPAHPFQALIDETTQTNTDDLFPGAGAMNIREVEDCYEIELQALGYTDEELSIEVTDNTLTVAGAKDSGSGFEESDDTNLVRQEWQLSQFSRSVRFERPIKEDGVEAKLENGILTITVPKADPAKPKVQKIKVKKK